MLSILIQLNPGYLLGITEKEPLVSHRRGTAEGVSRFRSPSQRVPGREAEAGPRWRLGCISPGPGGSQAGRRLSWSPCSSTDRLSGLERVIDALSH